MGPLALLRVEALKEIAFRSDVDISPATLAGVVVAHVAAAFLVVQLFEARRQMDPVPLMVSLLPQSQAVEGATKSMPQPVQNLREKLLTQEIEPEPIFRRAPEPVIPRQPDPVVAREPAPAPVPEPEPALRQELTEPDPADRIVVPLPAPVPAAQKPLEPQAPPIAPARAVTEVSVAPVVQPPTVTEIAAAPAIVQPRPVASAPPAKQADNAAEELVMTQQMLTAAYLRNPKPSYPNLSRRLNEQGIVLLRVFVTTDGDARHVELKESSGYPRLDRAALDAVQTWKFAPARKGEQVMAAWVVVPIRFSLKG